MRALVTGVSGFVGGHLAEHLIESGDLVVGLSASGRWPEAALARLAHQVRIERVRPGRRSDEDELAALDRPETARGHLSPRRAKAKIREQASPTRGGPGP